MTLDPSLKVVLVDLTAGSLFSFSSCDQFFASLSASQSNNTVGVSFQKEGSTHEASATLPRISRLVSEFPDPPNLHRRFGAACFENTIRQNRHTSCISVCVRGERKGMMGEGGEGFGLTAGGTFL